MAYRKEKLEEQIKRIISSLLITDIKDPRIGFVTITGVSLSKDFSVARVGVSVMGTPRELRKSLEGLNSAIGYIQHKVGKGVHIKTVPRVEFFLDSSVADGVDMVNFIDDVVSHDDNNSNDDNDEVGISE